MIRLMITPEEQGKISVIFDALARVGVTINGIDVVEPTARNLSVLPGLPVDGSPTRPHLGSKGRPQPPRRVYSITSKAKLDRVDWEELQPAAKEVAEYLNAGKGSTMQDIRSGLGIARSTAANAITELTKRGVINVQAIKRQKTKG